MKIFGLFAALVLFLTAPLACNLPTIHLDRLPVAASNTLNALPIHKANKRSDIEASVAISRIGSYGHGSGTYVSHKGRHLILTAAHVVDGPLMLVHGPKHTVMGKVVYINIDADISFLLVPKLDDRKSVPLTFPKKMEKVGTHVHYTGFPMEINQQSYSGEVAGYRENQYMSVHGFGIMGISGSGVFDNQGDLIGVAVAVMLLDWEGDTRIVEDILYVTSLKAVKRSELDYGIRMIDKINNWDLVGPIVDTEFEEEDDLELDELEEELLEEIEELLEELLEEDWL